MSIKRIILLLSLLFFILALFLRYSEYTDISERQDRIGLYAGTLGVGTDPDAEIMCGVSFARHDSAWWCPFAVVDYLFISPYMGFLMETFGFIKGLEFIAYSTIFVGALITITPFLFLSLFEKRFSIGGFFASIAILVNYFLIYNSSGRIVKYNASLLFFTVFFVFFYYTRCKTICVRLLKL